MCREPTRHVPTVSRPTGAKVSLASTAVQILPTTKMSESRATCRTFKANQFDESFQSQNLGSSQPQHALEHLKAPSAWPSLSGLRLQRLAARRGDGLLHHGDADVEQQRAGPRHVAEQRVPEAKDVGHHQLLREHEREPPQREVDGLHLAGSGAARRDDVATACSRPGTPPDHPPPELRTTKSLILGGLSSWRVPLFDEGVPPQT